MNLRPVVELGVAEAYAILASRPDGDGLPPLDAIENEDWGRDWLLGRFEAIPADELASLGLRWDDGRGEDDPDVQSG